MRHRVVFILSFLFLGIVNIACDNSKTMQEYIREEKRAIDRYIDRQGFYLTNEYPADGKFQEKEYFKTSRGLYMHVVDPGDTSCRIALKELALVRFEYVLNVKDYISGNTDSISYPYIHPLEFIYGQSGTYTGLVCEGLAIPLAYVGNGAVVDLIIPSEIGNANDRNSFNPVFFKKLEYKDFIHYGFD